MRTSSAVSGNGSIRHPTGPAAPRLFCNTYPLKPKQRSVCMILRLPLSSDGERVDAACSLAIFIENEAALAEFFNEIETN